MMTSLTAIVSRSKNDDQMLILCLSYSIITVRIRKSYSPDLILMKIFQVSKWLCLILILTDILLLPQLVSKIFIMELEIVELSYNFFPSFNSLLLIFFHEGSFNYYVDKMRGGRGSKNVCFCQCSGYKNCQRRGGGQKMTKFCSRNC